MLHEITKHALRIFDVIKRSKKAFGGKVMEIIIEILIIVFAVSLSIWLHNWSLQRHQQKETTEFLLDLKEDPNKDIENMASEKTLIAQTVKQYAYLKELTEKQADSLSKANATLDLEIRYVLRKTNNGNYEGFKSSGKIGFIENKNLKKKILEYYQETMPILDEAEDYYNSRLAKIEEVIYQNENERNLIVEYASKTSFGFAILSARKNMEAYDETTKLAKKIISEIDSEVDE